MAENVVVGEAIAENKRRVVIVGGGHAGSLVAKILQAHAHVVLIDQKEYYEVPFAFPRLIVEPSFGERALINHRDYLVNGRLVISSAASLREKEILTSHGEWIPYDYLVVATGHPHDTSPNLALTMPERMQQFQQAHEKVVASKSILIIGGGPAGVELAAEIAVDYPDKKVTIVHKGPRLVQFLGDKASVKTMKWLVERKVVVLLDQAIELDALAAADHHHQNIILAADRDHHHEFVTTKGTKIAADCWFNCIGKRLGSSWLEEGILKSSLDNRGQLMVDQQLRVRGKPNIFAIGDITDIPEIKQGYLAHKHAEVAAMNIRALLSTTDHDHHGADQLQLQESKKITMKMYKAASKPMALVSLGRKMALIQVPLTTQIGRIPGKIKSTDMFVGKVRQELGVDQTTSCIG